MLIWGTTANGRADSSGASYYVINDSKVTGSSADGTFTLGRPWGAYARVVFQHTAMSSVINPVGWSVWQKSDTRTGNVSFGEYKNGGVGASGTRAAFAKKLSSPIAIGTLFSSTSWIDSAFLPAAA